MKRYVFILLGLVFSAGLFAADINVVPYPRTVVEREGTYCVGAGTNLADIAAHETDATIPPEGYRLSIVPDGVKIASSDAAGAFYAVETLKQLASAGDDGGVALPCVDIEDSPRYEWRGVHIDEARHFFGKETVKQVLDLMAQHKLNRFHWHLTDDQGWRLEIPGRPELVKFGAVRPASIRHGIRYLKAATPETANGVKYGPFFYTADEVREIIAYAAARHITVVPEIEFPGHFFSVLAAYPQFACFPESAASREPRVSWAQEYNVMCIGNDEAVKFMEEILDYVCGLFPGEVVHIGGDECPQDMWRKCQKCQARIKAEGLKDEHGLQPWITARMVKFLESRGKRAIGWDEYLLGDIPKSAMGMSWREGRTGAGHEHISGARAAIMGHDVIMSPCSSCYLDYEQGLADDPFVYIGGHVPLAKCYSFDLCAGVPEECRSRILGGQCNNWSEFTWNEYDLAWKMWPRTCALAEVFWLGEAKPGFDCFRRRMGVHRRRLISQCVNCAPLE